MGVQETLELELSLDLMGLTRECEALMEDTGRREKQRGLEQPGMFGD